MVNDCDTCKHIDKNWDDLPCDGCCTAHSGYEADAISRQAVLDILKDKWNMFSDANDAIQESIDTIEALPPVTPQPKTGHWIPVSERLPEDAYGCLVTVYDTDLRTQDEFENILPYFVGYDGETWNNADGEPIPFEVIAWMPLPKPYEPQERSDKK